MSRGKQASEGAVTLNQNGGATDREVQAKKYDEVAVAERMSRLNEDIRQRKENDKARADELAKIPVRAEDVALVAAELGLPTLLATAKLQQCGGDPDRVFRQYIGLSCKA